MKRSESGMIVDPVTLPPTATLSEAEALMAQLPHQRRAHHRANGHRRQLVGILTNRDIRFVEPADMRRPVSEFMTRDGLVTAPVGTTLSRPRRCSKSTASRSCRWWTTTAA